MIMVRPNDPVTAADGLDRAAIFALRRFRGWRLRALQPQGANYRKPAGGGAVLAHVSCAFLDWNLSQMLQER
jgi:hypothetical protein